MLVTTFNNIRVLNNITIVNKGKVNILEISDKILLKGVSMGVKDMTGPIGIAETLGATGATGEIGNTGETGHVTSSIRYKGNIPCGIDYARITVLLVEELKKKNTMINTMQNTIIDLVNRVGILENLCIAHV